MSAPVNLAAASAIHNYGAVQQQCLMRRITGGLPAIVEQSVERGNGKVDT
jgi:hypothetical protein